MIKLLGGTPVPPCSYHVFGLYHGIEAMKLIQQLPFKLTACMLAINMAMPVYAQSDEEKDEEKQDTSVEKVVVTGSFIPRDEYSEITPLTIITAEEMKAKGLMTLEDVVGSFTENTGYSEGSMGNVLSGFTTGATEVNFRGLGSGRSLVLLNGRRLADYPLPFGGEQNGVDLGAIPFSAIERVEYLSSGASAIYGSDAVGGVLNIITKKDMEQSIVALDTGINEKGYGEFARASFVTGTAFQHGSISAGIDVYQAAKVSASDADYIKDNAPYNILLAGLQEYSPTGYQNAALPDDVCERLNSESTADGCVRDSNPTITLTPKSNQVSLFLDGRYDLTDDIDASVFLTYTDSSINSDSQLLGWTGVAYTANDPLDGADDEAYYFSRAFSPEELGVAEVLVDQTSWTASASLKGRIDIGDNQWLWDLSYSHADYESTQRSYRLKEEGLENWLFGNAGFATDVIGDGSFFEVDGAYYQNGIVNDVFRNVTSAEKDALAGYQNVLGKSNADNIGLTITGELGTLGFAYKPVNFAVRTEWARQSNSIVPDERTLNTTGQGWLDVGSTVSEGSRDRKALGVEVNIPVSEDLELTLASRIDHYSDDSSIASKATSQARFLYNLTDTLKLRGGWSQNFRAPDLFNIYGESKGFNAVFDLNNGNPACFTEEGAFICGASRIVQTRSGDKSLTEEYGEDFNLGLVWRPTNALGLSLSWYKLTINDMVNTESAQDLVTRQYSCSNGTFDANSASCRDVNERIIRDLTGQITEVIVRPVNQDKLTQEGIDVSADYSVETERLGTFSAGIRHSQYLAFELQRFGDEEPYDIRQGEVGLSMPSSYTNFTFNWNKKLEGFESVGASLFIMRQGRVKNYFQTQFMQPYYTTNFSTYYRFSGRLGAQLSVNNLLNTAPDMHNGGVWPNFWAHLQDPTGRSYSLSVVYNF
jgi:iron complex outermembrane recepter protein